MPTHLIELDHKLKGMKKIWSEFMKNAEELYNKRAKIEFEFNFFFLIKKEISLLLWFFMRGSGRTKSPFRVQSASPKGGFLKPLCVNWNE